MKDWLANNKIIPWDKQGLIYAPPKDGFTHSSHPCCLAYSQNNYIVAFSRRDVHKRSQIFLAMAEAKHGHFAFKTKPKLCWTHGEPGHFDCDGAISVCLIEHNGCIYLYYVGWQNLLDIPWTCETGRLRLDPKSLTLEREFKGPVLARDKDNPIFASGTAFLIENDRWKTWYNSALKWNKTEAGWQPQYGIHYAESSDGVDWQCEPGLCLPFRDDHEYAFGRPCIFKEQDMYIMWYAHRATKTTDTYRIGVSISKDGRNWIRKDHLAGIDVSDTGWDSEMICYPCVFKDDTHYYMLYNGNGYGETGIGLATLPVATFQQI